MDDLISRQAAIEAAEKESQIDGAYGYMDTKSIIDLLHDLPPADVEVKCIATVQFDEEKLKEIVDEAIVKCKDCKHFELDKPYVIQGVPVLGHEVCNAWGEGCKTDQNGFCFMCERREDATF